MGYERQRPVEWVRPAPTTSALPRGARRPGSPLPRPQRRRILGAIGPWVAAALLTHLAACAAMDGSVSAPGGFQPGGDATVGSDVFAPGADGAPGPSDVIAPDAAGDAGRDGGGKTDNPAPPAGPTRLSLALDGDRAAWVEVAPDGQPALVVWTLDAPDVPPTPYPWPYLVQPRALQLTDGWLVFVDDPYNDPDVFALRLADGAVWPVVTKPGVQHHPAVLPSPGPPGATPAPPLVAWEDCRECLDGAEPTPEIYLRPLAHGDEVRITDDQAADTKPVAGTLADGAPALAWLVDGGAARVWSPGASPSGAAGVDLSVPLPFPDAAGVALTRGMLASRPSPLIINPDSMIPSDVFLTELTSLQTRRLSTHAELTAAAPAAPVARGGRVAWVESVPGAATDAREVVVVDADDPSVELLRAPLDGVSEIALSAAWLGATVPAPDDLTDVWFQALP